MTRQVLNYYDHPDSTGDNALRLEGTVHLDATFKQSGEDVELLVSPSGSAAAMVSGTHTITGGEAAANTLTIDTGLSSITTHIVQILDSGNNVVTSDADITKSGGNLTVADGATYNTTSGYKIHWIVVGAI